MEERIKKELALLRSRFPEVEYKQEGHWFHIPSYHLPEGWNRSATDIVFQIPQGYPGAPPYGFYVLSGILFREAQPDNYSEPAPTQPPFPGPWGMFSWSPVSGQWRATADLSTGSNLLNWAMGFADRLRLGK